MELKYADELTQEQAHFDTAREHYEAKQSSKNPSNWTVGNGPERRAMKQAMDARPTLDAEDPVAIGRIILDDGTSHHIGKVSIMDDQSNPLVISWKAPVAERFYQATTEDRLGVATKRQFTTTRNHVDAFNDKVFAELAKRVSDLYEELRSDDALLHSLQASRTGKMADIVQTIQASQDKLIREHKDQLLVIQGGPGTGKTAVALHRVSWLLFNYRDELPAHEVLVVGPNPAFTKYIQQVLPALGDKHVRQTSIQELLGQDVSVRAVEPDNIATVKGSAEMADFIATALDHRIKAPDTPLRIMRRNSASFVTIPVATITPVIQELRHKRYGEGRELLRARLLEHCAKAVSTASPRSGAELMEPASVEAAMDRMWPRLSPTQFIRELFGSKLRLRNAGDKLLGSEQLELLFRVPADRIADEPWTIADLALIDLASEYMNGDPQRYGHFVVDEAQDLSPMQLLALNRRTKNGSMTIVGDVAQSTGPFARNSWDDVIASLKYKVPANLQHLEHGYRVPEEVYAVAERLLPVAAPGIPAPKVVRPANAKPQLFDVVRSQLAREVANAASHHSGKGRFVGVIAPKEWWEEIQDAFRAAEVSWSDSSAGHLGTSINLVTPEDSKGLEFDAVVVVDPQAIFDRDNGARLLYIALTRTTNRLDVIAPAGEIPQLIRSAFPEIRRIDDPVAPPKAAKIAAKSNPTPLSVVQFHEAKALEEAKAKESPTITMDSVLDAPAKNDQVSAEFEKATRAGYTENGLGPVERELVKKNAEYLHEVLLTMYDESIRREILLETLRILGD